MLKLRLARRAFGAFATLCAIFMATPEIATSEVLVPARVVSPVIDRDSVVLVGNTHPLATAGADRGRVDPALRLERMMLVLQRSPEQNLSLAAFNEHQQDRFSPDYHHWLSPQDFGRLYGPADADISAVTTWLQSHGLQVLQVNAGKVSIEFSGTVAQVEGAFQLQMHRYWVNNEERIANDRNPQIPRALTPVINGIASLNNFRKASLAVLGKQVRRDMRTGKVTPLEPVLAPLTAAPRGSVITPNFGYTGNDDLEHEDVTPYDFATIYNSLPLWNASTPIIGTGVAVAIAAGSDIASSDVATFRASFGLPAKSFTTVHNGADPGETGENGDQVENTLDVEMSGAAAPGANITLVVSADTSTTYGFELSMQYIVSNDTAPIMSASYGICELTLGNSGNSFFEQIEQQGATEGMTIFISAGDQGAAGCDGHQATPDKIGLAVNGAASTPYVTAVGGTDFTWSFVNNGLSTYWNSTTDSNGATAKGYLPEVPWNSTCVNPYLLGVFLDNSGNPYPNSEALCNAAAQAEQPYLGLIAIAAGSGGTSTCETQNSSGDCTGGYAKPSWQTGTGVPSDGARNLPDVSLYSSNWIAGNINGSAILFCYATTGSNGCDYSNPDVIDFQEIGGTSAASPYMAGVMAMIVQKTGVKQGLANPTFYRLAAAESLSSCNTMTVKNGNTCIFYDITTGLNAQTCVTGAPDCTTNTSGDAVGIQDNYSAGTGYDRASGLGTVNIANLVNGWAGSTPTPTVSVSPSTLTFSSTTVGSTSSAQAVTLKNTGSVTVSLSSVSLTGGQSDDFALTTTCGTSLAAGASCTASVTFKPVSTGTKSASLSFADSAGGSPQTVALSGSGSTSSGPAAVKLSATSLTFANQAPNTTSAAQTVTVTNSGSATLTFTSIALTGGQADDYSLSKTCGSTLAGGASCTLSVTFKPVSTGTKNASISIADNASGSPQTVALTGTGSSSSGPAAVKLSATSLTFTGQAPNTTSPAQTVTVTNSGSATLTFTSIALTGGQADDYSLSKTCGSTLTGGASCTLSVTFTPVSTGTKNASISIADNASGSPQIVSLTGTGSTLSGPAAVKLSATSLTFAAQKAGTTSSAQTVTITNTGAATLSFSSIALSGGQADDFVLSKTCASTLAGGASCVLSVSFNPVSAGTKSAKVSIADNASGSPQSVALSGTGD